MITVEVGDGVTGGYQMPLETPVQVNAVLPTLVRDWQEVRAISDASPGVMLVVTATDRKKVQLPRPEGDWRCAGPAFEEYCRRMAAKIMKEREN